MLPHNILIKGLINKEQIQTALDTRRELTMLTTPNTYIKVNDLLQFRIGRDHPFPHSVHPSPLYSFSLIGWLETLPASQLLA